MSTDRSTKKLFLIIITLKEHLRMLFIYKRKYYFTLYIRKYFNKGLVF